MEQAEQVEATPVGAEILQAKGEDPPVVTPTIGEPQPVSIQLVSQMSGLELEAEIDTAVLDEWWRVMGVDAPAMPVKELGEYDWRTPGEITIVLGDISGLTTEQRWQLYKPTAASLDQPPVAGLDTQWSENLPDKIEYTSYIEPEMLLEDRPVADVERLVNRMVL